MTVPKLEFIIFSLLVQIKTLNIHLDIRYLNFYLSSKDVCLVYFVLDIKIIVILLYYSSGFFS